VLDQRSVGIGKSAGQQARDTCTNSLRSDLDDRDKPTQRTGQEYFVGGHQFIRPYDVFGIWYS
jgi:hypothetical protein